MHRKKQKAELSVAALRCPPFLDLSLHALLCVSHPRGPPFCLPARGSGCPLLWLLDMHRSPAHTDTH